MVVAVVVALCVWWAAYWTGVAGVCNPRKAWVTAGGGFESPIEDLYLRTHGVWHAAGLSLCLALCIWLLRGLRTGFVVWLIGGGALYLCYLCGEHDMWISVQTIWVQEEFGADPDQGRAVIGDGSRSLLAYALANELDRMPPVWRETHRFGLWGGVGMSIGLVVLTTMLYIVFRSPVDLGPPLMDTEDV